MSPADAVTAISRLIDQDVDVQFQIRSIDGSGAPGETTPSSDAAGERRRARQARWRERRRKRLLTTPKATLSDAETTPTASPPPLDPPNLKNPSDLGKKEGNPEEEPPRDPGARGVNETLFDEKATPERRKSDAGNDAPATREKRVRTAGRKGFPPDDFAPNDSHRSLAAARNVDLALEVAKFKDHEFQRKITDWDRTFSNWLRNARSSAGPAITARNGSQNVIDRLMADAVRLRSEGR